MQITCILSVLLAQPQQMIRCSRVGSEALLGCSLQLHLGVHLSTQRLSPFTDHILDMTRHMLSCFHASVLLQAHVQSVSVWRVWLEK